MEKIDIYKEYPSIPIHEETLILERALEFQGSKEIRNLILELSEEIPMVRSVRGDGNCFYRALAFSYLEYILVNNDKERIEHLIREIKGNKRIYNNKFKFVMKDDIIKDGTKKIENILNEYRSLTKNTFEDFFNEFNSDLIVDIILVLTFRNFALQGYENFEKKTNNNFISIMFDLYKAQKSNILNYAEEAQEGAILFLANQLNLRIIVNFQDRNVNRKLDYCFNNEHIKTEFNEMTILFYFRPGHYDIGYSKDYSKKLYEDKLKKISELKQEIKRLDYKNKDYVHREENNLKSNIPYDSKMVIFKILNE